MLHYQENCLHVKIMDNHGEPWSAMVDHGRPCFIEWNMVNDGQPWLNVALWQILSWYEKHPWSTMVRCRIMTNIISIWKQIMVKHGQAWSNVSLWQGLSQYWNPPWSTMFILGFIIFILAFIYLRFIIFIPWVYYSLWFII